MYRRNPPKPPVKPVDDVLAHNGITPYLRQFLEWSASMNYSARTNEHRDYSVRRFIAWCDQRGLTRPHDITRPILERFRQHLFHYRKKDGDALNIVSQAAHLAQLRAFFRWLARENHILHNPASELEMPRIGRRIPKHRLTVEEVERILNQTNVHGEIGIRDRAIMETLYSTGIRRFELADLKIKNLDFKSGEVMVNGKGDNDRLIPIGERACAWARKYLDEVRPGYVIKPDTGIVFLTEYGEAFKKSRLTDLVRKHIVAAGIDKPGSCHLFRHAMATHMLDNGADIRFIQAILGHENLSTTQIYTHVSIKKLKEVHAATHPATQQLKDHSPR
jgi:integrase/recombinase XerD